MEETEIAPSPDYKIRIVKGKVNDLAYAQALFNEALNLILEGEESGLYTLRELINSTFGFDRLAAKIHKPAQSLRRMLSTNGNPTFRNIIPILSAIRKILNVQIEVTVIPAWKARELDVEKYNHQDLS